MRDLPYCPVCGTLVHAHTAAMSARCNAATSEAARTLSAFLPPVHEEEQVDAR